jgi:hypothetical protein
MRDGCRPFGDEIGRKIWGRKIGKKGADGGWRNRAYASDDAIKVDFMIKVKERAIGMGNRSRA